MSVAIAQVFGPALDGRSKERPELAGTPIPLCARLEVLPCRGGENLLYEVFQPLGYEIEAVRYPLDEQFDEWGQSPYYSVTLSKTTTLSELLAHLYVLIPVFDNFKHYYVGNEELEKLLKHGEGWLSAHPKREAITHRYLKHRHSLAREALARLAEQEDQPDESLVENRSEGREESLEKPISLNEQRLDAVVAALKASGASAYSILVAEKGSCFGSFSRKSNSSRSSAWTWRSGRWRSPRSGCGWTICPPGKRTVSS